VKLVILDRDGVINRDSDAYIKTPEEWQPIEGSLAAIARLTQAGWRIVVATNQSGISRGLFDLATLAAIHEKMSHAVSSSGGRIDAVFFCPHAGDHGCECRKPRDGMVREIIDRFRIQARAIPMIGDSLRDLQAADAAGCQPMLVLTGKGQKTLAAGGLPAGTTVHEDLAAATAQLLA
jgi:D-glycero-D-manno-heptose 1,7-bisphosphate phosphatase